MLRPSASLAIGAAACLACGLSGCDRSAPITRVPAGQERKVAALAAAAPDTAPPRTGGFLNPPEVGRQIRAQAVRPPPPGTTIHPPPAGT